LLERNCHHKCNPFTLKLTTAALVMESFTSSVNHTEEVAAMSKSVEELHNMEDATSFKDALLLFFGFVLFLGFLGVLFWSAF